MADDTRDFPSPPSPHYIPTAYIVIFCKREASTRTVSGVTCVFEATVFCFPFFPLPSPPPPRYVRSVSCVCVCVWSPRTKTPFPVLGSVHSIAFRQATLSFRGHSITPVHYCKNTTTRGLWAQEARARDAFVVAPLLSSLKSRSSYSVLVLCGIFLCVLPVGRRRYVPFRRSLLEVLERVRERSRGGGCYSGTLRVCSLLRGRS